MTVDRSKYRKPKVGPSSSEVADAERWFELGRNSLATTQAAAEKWRNGLGAFVTLVTGGLLLKGPEAAHAVSRPGLALITALAAAGLALAVIGLWLALRAAAGSPAKANLVEVVRQHGGVRQFEVMAARIASGKLAWARRCVAASLVLLGATVLVWWWAPTRALNPPAFVTIEHDSSSTCGQLLSGDGGVLVLQVSGHRLPSAIPYGAIENLTLVDAC